MQNVTLSSSFFEESRIKALSLQKDGETALLLWLKVFFTAVREECDGRLMLYGEVAHDEKSIFTVYGVPVNSVKSVLELLTKFSLLDRNADCFCISNFTELLSAEKRERHRKEHPRYAGNKAAELSTVFGCDKIHHCMTILSEGVPNHLLWDVSPAAKYGGSPL